MTKEYNFIKELDKIASIAVNKNAFFQLKENHELLINGLLEIANHTEYEVAEPARLLLEKIGIEK